MSLFALQLERLELPVPEGPKDASSVFANIAAMEITATVGRRKVFGSRFGWNAVCRRNLIAQRWVYRLLSYRWKINSRYQQGFFFLFYNTQTDTGFSVNNNIKSRDCNNDKTISIFHSMFKRLFRNLNLQNHHRYRPTDVWTHRWRLTKMWSLLWFQSESLLLVIWRGNCQWHRPLMAVHSLWSVIWSDIFQCCRPIVRVRKWWSNKSAGSMCVDTKLKSHLPMLKRAYVFHRPNPHEKVQLCSGHFVSPLTLTI